MHPRAIYTIESLVSDTGVTKRTIYKYVQRGVIPRPYGRGSVNGGLHWGEEHLRAIRKVQEARDNNVTLADLAVRFGYQPVNDGWEDEVEVEVPYIDLLDQRDLLVSYEELYEHEADDTGPLPGDWRDDV